MLHGSIVQEKICSNAVKSKMRLDPTLLSSTDTSRTDLPKTVQKKILQFVHSCLPEWEETEDEIDGYFEKSSSLSTSHLTVAFKYNIFTLTGGMTNIVFCCEKVGRGKNHKILLRCFGSNLDMFINRSFEIMIFRFLSEIGLGPKLLAEFENGRIEEFLHANTLTNKEIRSPRFISAIAPKIARFHSLKPSFIVPEPQLPSLLLKWHCFAKSGPKLLGSNEMSFLESSVSEILAKLKESKSRPVFCHNDLQYGNIMWVNRPPSAVEQNSDVQSIKSVNGKGIKGLIDTSALQIYIIDYEYASYNYRGFDIGNHFCEYCTDYTSEVPHVFNVEKFPDEGLMTLFCSSYLGNDASASEVESLILESKELSLASHVLWACWSIGQARISSIHFNYIEYARERLKAYSYFKKLWGL